MKRAVEYEAEWIGRRIREIMDDRGVNIRSLSDQLNTLCMQRTGEKFGSHMLLQRSVNGYIPTGETERIWRPLNVRELSLIAECLAVTPDRFLQKDTEEDRKRIEDLFIHVDQNKREAIEIAYRLVNVAIGATERSESLYYLGNVQYFSELYEEALETLSEALKYAQSTELTYKIYDRMSLAYLYKGDYYEHNQILERAKAHLFNHPYHLGRFYMLQAYNAFVNARKKDSRKYNFLAYVYLKKVKDGGWNENIQYSRACNNLGERRYEQGQYRTALFWFLEAENYSQNDTILNQYRLTKRIIQCYIALGILKEAKKRLEAHIRSGINYPSTYGEVGTKLLRAHVTDDQQLANSVLSIAGLEEWIYAYAHAIIGCVNLKVQEDTMNLEHFDKTLMYFALKI